MTNPFHDVIIQRFQGGSQKKSTETLRPMSQKSNGNSKPNRSSRKNKALQDSSENRTTIKLGNSLCPVLSLLFGLVIKLFQPTAINGL
jgi:hypothetical protein